MQGDAEHPERCVIQFNAASATINPATGNGYGTDGSATFTIGNYCDNLEFVGITFDNCATRERLVVDGQQAGQALAMLIHDYSDLRDILFASNDNGETKSKTYKPEIRPAVIVR